MSLAEGDGAVDRGAQGAASLISRASLSRLAEAAGKTWVDGRRFRMLVEIDGVGRRGLQATEPLPFGIYGEVLQPGEVRVGDPVTLVD